MMEESFDEVRMLDLMRKVREMRRKGCFLFLEFHAFVLPFIPFQVSAPLGHRDDKETPFVSFHVCDELVGYGVCLIPLYQHFKKE